jgi:CRISPR-associated protein Cmr2
LLMDGDHMGRLVNGETLASRWNTVLHQDLIKRLEDTGFDPKYRSFWQKRLDQQRFLSPAVHAAISEALGDFSLYSVPKIITKYRGRLIYAGGDDIFTILPVSTALDAATEIAAAYSYGFVTINKDGKVMPLSGEWEPKTDRLALHLGKGKGISISAGILIAHHKKPLSNAIRRVHLLLDIAKEKGGRNALALELDKRAGGSKLFTCHWNQTSVECLNLIADDPASSQLLIEHLKTLGAGMQRSGGSGLSSSMAYRMEELKPGLEAIAAKMPEKLPQFISKQISRSAGVKEKDEEKNLKLAGQISALIAQTDKENGGLKIDTDALIISRFIGVCSVKVNGKEVQDGNKTMAID